MKKLTVAVVFLAAAIVFLFRLENNPPGFHIDEAVIGYEASHLLTSGGYSSNGEFLPRYIAIDTDKQRSYPGAYILYVIPFIELFGLSEWAVRLSSVIASLLCMGGLFLILNKKIGYLPAIATVLWWPFTSWVWLFSRVGLEHTFYAGLYVLATWLVYLFMKEVITMRKIVLFVLTMGLLFYSYTAARLFALLFMIVAGVIMVKKKASIMQMVVMSVGFLAIVLLSWPYIADGSFFYRTNELKTYCGGMEIVCFIKNLGTHLSPFSFFRNTFIPLDFPVLTHSVVGTSFLPRVLFPFLAAGVFILVKRALEKDSFALAIIIALTIAIIPASFTIRGFDSRRSFAMVPLLFIVVGYGMHYMLLFMKNKSRESFLAAVTVFFIASIPSATYEMYRFHQYEFYPQVASLHGWQYGYKQILEYVATDLPNDAQVYISPQVAYKPRSYVLFFKSSRGQMQNIIVGGVACYKDPKMGVYYVVRPTEIQETGYLRKVKDILYPNNKDVVFSILKLEY